MESNHQYEFLFVQNSIQEKINFELKILFNLAFLWKSVNDRVE